MYAVIETGGKQYRVSQGSRLRVERLPVDAGGSVEIERVLLMGEGSQLTIGTPYVPGGKVTVKVNAHGRGKKIHIQKFRRRKHHEKRTGHRQDYTEIEVTGIHAG